MNYKEETINSYDKHTKYLSKYFQGLFDLSKRKEFNKFMELLEGKKILDMGCGSGEHALYFKEKDLDVTCIDLSKEMIKLCKSKKLNARLMDIENLTFPDNSFDGIWAVTSLLHIPKTKIPKIIEKLHSILTSKGLLYICLKEGKGERLIEDKQDKSTKRFFAFWTKEELLKLLNKNFQLIEFGKLKYSNTTFLHFFLRKR